MKLYVKPGRVYRLDGREHGPGALVEVPDKLAGVLAHSKGPLQREPVDSPSPPASADAADDLKAARAEYQKVLDRRPYPGWDVAELRSRISTYRTTHMTAG